LSNNLFIVFIELVIHAIAETLHLIIIHLPSRLNHDIHLMD